MKEKIIRRLNITGHIGQIIALLFKIIVIIALLCTVSLTILSFGLPKDTLDVTVTRNADADVNFTFTGHHLSSEEQQAVQSGSQDLMTLLMRDKSLSLQKIIKGVGGTVKYKDVTDSTANVLINKVAPVHVSLEDIRYFLLLADLELLLLLICVFVASSLCKELRFCDSPFEYDVIRKLRFFAFSLLPWALVGSFGSTIVSRVFSSDQSVVVDINIGILIIVLVILTLTRIFKYGALLQQESDETV